jgi:hypothetical protein
MSDPVFNFELGGMTPAPKTRRVDAFYESTGAVYTGPLQPTATPDAEWFSAHTANINAPLDYVFTVDPARLNTHPAGTLHGTLHLSSPDPDIIYTPLDILVTVNISDPMPPPINQAPVVKVNDDLEITLPSKAHLHATITDDQLGSPLLLQWRKVDGPGDVVFDSPTLADTLAAFSVDGVYRIALDASDGALTGSDECIVTVHAEPLPPEPPVVIDIAAPIVTITDPQNGAHVTKKVWIRAKSTDENPILEMEIFINGVSKMKGSGPFVQWQWNTATYKKQTVLIGVHATDKFGNIGTAAISVVIV